MLYIYMYVYGGGNHEIYNNNIIQLRSDGPTSEGKCIARHNIIHII